MADYYLQFSTELDAGFAENAQTALKLYEQFNEDEEWGANFLCEADGDRLWLHEVDGSGDPESVAKFVCKLAKQFNLKGKWGFEYAATCSKPVLDAFGGGAVAIDLATGHVEVINTHSWLADHTKSGSRVREGTALSLAAFL
jgi:hypothetical protein